MNEADRELLQALIQGFDRAMLVCRCRDGMRARPTTVASSSDSEFLWLLSGTRDTRFEELDEDPNVNVVMQDGSRFCSVTGTARVARYATTIRPWFGRPPRAASAARTLFETRNVAAGNATPAAIVAYPALRLAFIADQSPLSARATGTNTSRTGDLFPGLHLEIQSPT